MQGPAQYNIPFVAPLQSPLLPGRVIGVNGVVPPNSQRFDVNLQCGAALDPESDIALHVSVRLDEGVVVRNALTPDGWGNEERHGALPIQPGQPFEILVLCEPSAFKIAFNGAHFTEFFHRMPYEKVTYLSICGLVDVSSISGVIASPPIQAFSPPVPHVMAVPGNLYPGRQVRVRGYVPPTCIRFEVNLQLGPRIGVDDVALHFSFRPVEGYIAINSFRDGGWEEEGREDNLTPLGSTFDLLIICEPDDFKVALNGSHFVTLDHRMPPSLINTVAVQGDVQLSLVSIEGR